MSPRRDDPELGTGGSVDRQSAGCLSVCSARTRRGRIRVDVKAIGFACTRRSNISKAATTLRSEKCRQAARRSYRWCNPPTSENATTRPSVGASMPRHFSAIVYSVAGGLSSGPQQLPGRRFCAVPRMCYSASRLMCPHRVGLPRPRLRGDNPSRVILALKSVRPNADCEQCSPGGPRGVPHA